MFNVTEYIVLNQHTIAICYCFNAMTVIKRISKQLNERDI